MREDYLWDKTGEDAEIEKLENALMAFRYTETAPPELPAKVFEIKKEKPRRFFQFGFAFAAFASVVVILFAVWFQVSSSKIAIVESVAEINKQKKADKVDVINPEIKPIKAVAIPKHFNKQNVVKIRQTVAPINRANKFVAQNNKVKAPTETLTAEEKYAYDQLMLALSVTSSSLKLVKDKVEGIEEKTAVLDTAK
jgi:CRISPR/Cas system endoribonuclease Cas6 (RAMP superfamily)